MIISITQKVYTNYLSYELQGQSKVLLRCEVGHEWNSNVNNLLHYSTWCPACVLSERSLNVIDMKETADFFDGQFLGLI